jgi:prepilin-type processing-associated H-X9-DG protein
MTATPSDDQSPPDPVEGEAIAKPKLRGLWTVMQPADPPVEAAVPTADDAPVEEAAPRGLWSLMGNKSSSPSVVPETAEEEEVPFELVEPVESVLITDDENVDNVVEPEIPIEITADAPAVDALGDQFAFDAEEERPRPTRGWQALWLGLIALSLSTTAWFGLLWPSLVTAACGFGAILLAATEWTAGGAVNQSERCKVSVGALAGGLALVLGPYLFSPLGHAAREARSGRNTQRHLQRIGVALEQYHQQFGSFPIGGTIVRDAENRSRGGHSWMTAVLPYIGEQPLYQRIDFAHPYDEPVNRPAMSTPVIPFFAAGGNRALNGGGFAVAHFAGVGGEVRSPRGETQAAGIFRAGKPLSEEDISDGLSATLAAGELNGNYSAWGDPENLRVPGLGFNKDPRGFGNAARTGATMLFADGHVKFFANATDPEVLRRLSTRNAGDLTAGIE